MKKVKIVIGTAFQDAGDATRAIEIAKGIKKYQPNDIEAKIIFLSHGSRFEQKVLDLGFEVYQTEPKLPGVGLYQDIGMTPESFIGDKNLAKEMIKGEIKAYKELKPDIVLYGFWPMAGLARRMVEKEIPGICFIPLPLTEAFLDVIPDVPDQVKFLAVFPYKTRLWIFRHIPHFIKSRIPLIRQNNIREAAAELGWKGEPLLNLFNLLKADLTIVNDLPDYYDQSKFPKDVIFTGPLFAKTTNEEPIDLEIQKVFDPQNGKIKIFCTLSSSGSKEMLKEVIKVFTYGEGLNWNAVILSPHFSIEEAYKILGKREGVYITDKFIPAQKVNAMADIVVCHGGQGTVQTAIHSGTPLVGVAAQQEQFINLSNVAARGAGVRIPRAKWDTKNIQKSVSKIIADKRYREAMLKLRERINSMDGEKNAAEAIWKKIKELF
ncbi:MAG: nucleotide disphospho-sugar-binding domain-containing protein [Candidatus Paceibacterota bacterium]